MSVDAGTIRAGVEADLRDFDQGLVGLIESLEKAEAQARKVPPPLDEVAKELTEVGQAATQTSREVRASDASFSSIQRGARAAGVELEAADRKARPLRRTLSGVAQGLSGVGSIAGQTAGRVGSLGSAFLGAFSAGGGIALGIGAVTGAIGLLASRIRETAKEARQLDALHEVLGITGGEVERLRASFGALGQRIEQDVAVQILRVGTEAGISTEKIIEMSGQIKTLGDLMGGDFRGAAGQVFADHSAKAKETATAYDDIHDAISAVRGETDSVVRAEQRRLDQSFDQLSILKDQAEQQRILAEHERMRGSLFGDWAGHEAAVANLSTTRQQIAALEEEIEKREELLVQYQLEADAAKKREEAIRRREEATRKAEAREEASLAMAARVRQMEAQLAGDRIAELEAAAEEEIRIQQKAVDNRMLSEDVFADWVRARRAQLAKDIAEVERETEATQRARLRAVKELRAEAANDQIALAIIAADREIEEEERKVDGIKYTWDEYYRWRTAREAKLQADIGRMREAELREHKRQQERMARETERRLADEERMQVAGINAGFAFVSGFKRAIDSDDPGAWLGALLTGAGAIASLVPGGQVPGAVLGGLGSLFHDGGMVGIGGQPLPRYHSGGMIIAHRGLMLPEPGPGEVPILAQTGEGILSRKGVAAAGGPAAVRALNEGRASPGSAPSTNIYIQAFDPRSTEDVLDRVVEPAQYRRGMSRRDAKTTALQRRRLGTPRTGR